MRIKYILGVLILGTGFISFNFAEAHTSETHDSISAILHIDPQDSPKVGEKVTMYFEVSDKKDLFSADACDCLVEISQDSEIILSEPVEIFSENSIGTELVFAKPGPYKIIFSGTPKSEPSFNEFTFEYQTEVREEDSRQPSKLRDFLFAHGLHVTLFGGAFVVVYALYLRDIYRQRKAAKK